MLDISLIPKASGSTGFGRFYPHQGYLGLSPVSVEGTIVARLPPLYPSLPIRQVTVTIRCVATRTIGSDVEAVLWEKAKRLWEPAGEAEYEEVGDWSAPFKTVIPVEAAREAASAQWTRDLKVVWQLQVAFDHKPIQYVGNRIVKTYLLDIHSYVTRPVPPPSPPSAIHTAGAQVCLNPPHGPFGPGDSFTISLHVKPDDPAASIRRTTLVIERRTRLLDSLTDTPERKERAFASWRRSNSPQPYSRLEEATVTKVLEMSSEEAMPGSGGMYWVSMTGTIPKRGGKWEAGETGETKVTDTVFDCRVKISLKTKSKVKEITCLPVPIVIVGSSASERTAAHAALAAEADSHPKASLPTRKHRSSRRGLYMQEGTTDISDPVIVAADSVARARRRHDRSASPTLAVFVAATEGVKPILLPSNPTPQPQSISFAFPSVPHSRPALPITTLIHPPSPTSANPTPTLPSEPKIEYFHPTFSPPSSAYPDMSILRQYQSTGRRISTSTSEEEEMQPSRSRIRLDDIPQFNSQPSFPPSDRSRTTPREADRPSLPSLDVLGLRLPPVPAYEQGPRRPRTAPVHSAFPSNSRGSSPAEKAVPPPLSGTPFLSPFDRVIADQRAGTGGQRPMTSGSGFRKGAEMNGEDEGAFAFGVGKR